MKKQTKLIATMILAVCLCASSAIFAASGTWIGGTGNWSDSGNWAGGIIPNGATDDAYFTNDIGSDAEITPDIAVTIRSIYVNDNDATENRYAITDTGQNITIAPNSVIDCATRFDLKCITEGTAGFTSTGAGTLNLGKTGNTISGTVNLNGTGQVIINNKDALQNADVVDNAWINSRKNEFNAKTITVGSSGQLNMFQVDAAFSNDPAAIIANSITVGSNGFLGSGFDTNNPTVGVPIKFISPSVAIESGGEILVKTTMASGGSIALPGISGSNIVVNNGGGINFGGANGVVNSTFTISNPLTLEGNGATASLGALITYANGVNLTNNSDITLTGNSRIGQWGVGGYMVMNKPITGTGNLEFLGQAAHWTHYKTYEFYATNTYSGNTKLISFAASTTYNVHKDQVFPNQPFALEVGSWNTNCWLTYDLNGHNQQVTYTEMNGPGTKTLKSTGGNGTLTITNGNTYGLVINHGGKLLLGGGNITTPSYVVVRDNSELIVTAGTFYCGLEIMNGHAGITGTVTVSDSGVIENFVFRNGDTDEPSTVNLNEGGVLKIGAMHALGPVADGSYLNFDGGTLSDGNWPEWSGSYSDWIQVITNLIVKAGGAKIEVNNANGRVINKALMHDSDLGSTADGGLTKLGYGTLILSNTCTYTGSTIVKDGALILNTLGKSKYLAVDEASVDDISGTLIIPSGATVSPGSSVGTMYVQNNLVMQSETVYNWEVGASYLADLISIVGNLDISSAAANSITVNVTTVSDVLPGDTNILFSAASINGNAGSIFMNYAIGNSGPENPFINGNNIEITDIIIPEPGIISILCLLAFAFISRKK